MHAPFGAHPGGLTGRYPVDRDAMRAYAAAAQSDEAFAAWLDEQVFGVEDHDDYVERFVPDATRGSGR